MAQERPTTPEKQLLDLIEDPKEQDVSQKKIKRKSFSLVSISALRGRLSFLLESVQSGSFFKNAIPDIKGLNKILKICIALLVVYLVGNFIMSLGRLKEVPEFVVKNTRSSKGVAAAELSSKKIGYYLEGPRSRDIFKFGDFGLVQEEVEESDEVAAPEVQTQTASEILVEKLGLVGIGWSDDPDVMVENTESKKIYFLKRGERIDGMIKVEAIFEDRVILTYDNGKERELR